MDDNASHPGDPPEELLEGWGARPTPGRRRRPEALRSALRERRGPGSTRSPLALIDDRLMPGIRRVELAEADPARGPVPEPELDGDARLGVEVGRPGPQRRSAGIVARATKPVRFSALLRGRWRLRSSKPIEGPEVAPQGRWRRPLKPPGPPRPAGSSVLLVEDHPVNRKVAARLLERLGSRPGRRGRGAGGWLSGLDSRRGRRGRPDRRAEASDMDGFETGRRPRRESGATVRGGRPAGTSPSPTNPMKGNGERTPPEAGFDGHLSRPIRPRGAAAPTLEGLFGRESRSVDHGRVAPGYRKPQASFGKPGRSPTSCRRPGRSRPSSSSARPGSSGRSRRTRPGSPAGWPARKAISRSRMPTKRSVASSTWTST